MPNQSNLALASVRVGGRQYSMVSQRTCKTCSSRYRDVIERDTVAGRTWAAIVRDLPDDAGLTARNLADHFRNEHLPVVAEAVQKLAELNATSAGELVQEGAEPLVDYLNFAKSLIGQVNDRVARGEVQPDVRDALRAAELLARYEPIEEIDEHAYFVAFVEYHEAAQAVMTQEQFIEFGRRLSQNPVLKDLARQADQRSAG